MSESQVFEIFKPKKMLPRSFKQTVSSYGIGSKIGSQILDQNHSPFREIANNIIPFPKFVEQDNEFEIRRILFK